MKDQSAAIKRGEIENIYSAKLRQMAKDIENTVGTENYAEITYWQNTKTYRNTSQEFKRQLNGQGGDLTPDQEAAIVDALYQATHGKATFSLELPFTPPEAKAAYIEEVKQALTTVLDQPSVDLLGLFLKNKAEHPTSMPVLTRTLPPSTPKPPFPPAQTQPPSRK